MRYLGNTSLVERGDFSKRPCILEARHDHKLAGRTRFEAMTKLFTQTMKKHKMFTAYTRTRTTLILSTDAMVP